MISSVTGAESGLAGDWKTIDLGAFSFSLPPDMKPQPLQASDAFISGSFQGEALQLEFDYGWFSSPLTRAQLPHAGDPQSFSEEGTLIDGRQAKMVHADWSAGEGAKPLHFWGVHFPDVPSLDAGPAREVKQAK
jgi:hypothetical protein